MGLATVDILLLTALAGNDFFHFGCFSHLFFLPYFFLPPWVRLGPLRVRAFCLVLWPRTGRPLR